MIHTDLKPENVLLKLTKQEIEDIIIRGKRTESLFKNIGHKLYDPNTKKDNSNELINMNKKKNSQINMPKSFAEDKDNVIETHPLITSQTNPTLNTHKPTTAHCDTILEPSHLECVDIDFDATDESNTLESTQVGSLNASDTN